MTRQEANREILNILAKEVEKCPHLRFGQLLIVENVLKFKKVKNFNINETPQLEDPFFEESEVILNRIKSN